MNVYDDPWLIAANAAIMAARQAAPAPAAGGPPAPEFAYLSHGTMRAYREGCRCGKCWQRNYDRSVRHRQARKERERQAAA